MANIKYLTVILSGLTLSLLGGIFALFYFNESSNFSFMPFIVIIIAVVAGVIGISVLIIIRKRTEESKKLQSSPQLEISKITESNHHTCYWCGFPIEKHAEFCSDCGKRMIQCIVCKLPISFGDEIGKCSFCESIGHFTHLFEWVKTKGKCPHCLQHMTTQTITTVLDIK